MLNDPRYQMALVAVAALLVGIALAWLAQRGGRAAARRQHLELERRLAAAEQQNRLIPMQQGQLDARDTTIAMLRDEKGELAAKLATAEEQGRQERKAAQEKLALLASGREEMTREFKLLSEQVLRGHSETFGQQNREQIGTLLGPLREKLAEFQLGLQTAQVESAKERAALAQQIAQLNERSTAMTTETLNLTRALKGKAQTQGAWGEMILATILERSGLREGEEYVTQASHSGDEGQRLRPDVIVNLPEGRRIVIDAKVSLVAFEAHVNAEAEADRALQLTAHCESLRRHIRSLGEKGYAAAVGGALDYVILFVPIEGALAAALTAEPDLTALATRSNVAIATPTTLMIALRTVANVWAVERRQRNADEIAQKAGAIYDKFVGFAEDMNSLGARLSGAQDSYQKAMLKLSSGKGNVVGQLQRLKAMGARASKALPPDLLRRAEPEPVEEESTGA